MHCLPADICLHLDLLIHVFFETNKKMSNLYKSYIEFNENVYHILICMWNIVSIWRSIFDATHSFEGDWNIINSYTNTIFFFKVNKSYMSIKDNVTTQSSNWKVESWNAILSIKEVTHHFVVILVIGGECGARGVNLIHYNDGRVGYLGSKTSIKCQAGVCT